MVSPINVRLLEFYLQRHPSRSVVSYVIEGFLKGFDLGFSGPIVDSRPRNLLSALNNPAPVTAAICKELERGHTSGPFSSPPFSPFHCSPLGAVPKKDGTFRIIMDLSSPRGCAINEGISKEAFSVRYSCFDDAVCLVRAIGRDTMMAKLDIKHAFRLCPVRPDQWVLLGYQWLGSFFVDTRLPFGCRSSPFIFNTFADLLQWILISIGGISFVIHYLDDFFICASTIEQCEADMGVMQRLFADLGVPLATDKTEGPASTITFLGIEIDAKAGIVRLPSVKLEELAILLSQWKVKKKCTKRELLSLIGSLSFAAKVVKPGRMFLRRLIDLSTKVSLLHHHISLNAEARADVQWWIDFLPGWNGVDLIQSEPATSNALKLFTDASGQGVGAVFDSEWFSAPWPPSFKELHINFQELFAIVAAVFTWGHRWKDCQILFFTDNQAITHVWRSGTSSNQQIMKLVRHLFLFCAKQNTNVLMQHIPGHSNAAADALSRLQVDKFHRIYTKASRSPTQIDPVVWMLLD